MKWNTISRFDKFCNIFVFLKNVFFFQWPFVYNFRCRHLWPFVFQACFLRFTEKKRRNKKKLHNKANSASLSFIHRIKRRTCSTKKKTLHMCSYMSRYKSTSYQTHKCIYISRVEYDCVVFKAPKKPVLSVKLCVWRYVYDYMLGLKARQACWCASERVIETHIKKRCGSYFILFFKMLLGVLRWVYCYTQYTLYRLGANIGLPEEFWWKSIDLWLFGINSSLKLVLAKRLSESCFWVD